MPAVASTPLRLPCGLVLKNRLVKSAMTEKMAVNDQPTADHQRVYKRWAQGGWAVLITGNIMVDEKYSSSPGDVAVSGDDSTIVEGWTAWAKGVHEHGCCIIAQLNHPGRQSPLGAGKRSLFSKTLAPSAVPLNLGDSWIACLARALLFGTPQAMTRDQVDDVVVQFSRAAKLASKAGFDGVEIHAAHGFLLSQFLSSSSNTRSDEFGGSAEKRAEIVLRIIRAIRREVPQSFCVGVKINTTDHMNPGGFDEMLRQVELIYKEKPDYIQLSGGSFENPEMLSTRNSLANTDTKTGRAIAREGFFIQASKEIRRKYPDLLLVVTGGFRSRQGVNNALEDRACDAVGFGRPAVKFPDLPDEIMFNDKLEEEEARFDVETAPVPGWLAARIRSIGAGAETQYYSSLLRQL